VAADLFCLGYENITVINGFHKYCIIMTVIRSFQKYSGYRTWG